MRLKWKLTVASVKMLFRQKEAIIWSVLFPLFMILLFGFVNFGGMGSVELGVINEAGPDGEAFIHELGKVSSIELSNGTRKVELEQLTKGERDAVVVVPQGFSSRSSDTLLTFVNEGKPRETQLAVLILQRVLDEIAFQQSPPPARIRLKQQAVQSRNLNYIDFLLPGIISMSIMQMGIFGVAFGFVSLKKRGILRRLWVTPISPGDFILAQMATRLVLVMMQIVVLVGVGYLFFDLHFVGNVWEMFVVGILGAVVFLAIGLALAGISKSEDQVAPLANVISLPMMLLSGVFFSRSNLPDFIRAITDFFPLTYLADGMRSIAIDGATLTQVGPQILGLAVWAVITCVLAIKAFRWE
ncbi:MAG: ABC transporter permease [Bacteroidota bacterium]